MIKFIWPLFLFSFLVQAKVVDLVVWKVPGAVDLLIPQLEQTSSKNFSQLYLNRLNQSSTYQALMDVSYTRQEGEFSAYQAYSKNRPNIALVANRPGHMELTDIVFPTVLSELELAGAKAYVIPVGLELVLSKIELRQFHQLLSQRVPALVHLGGADVHPHLYGEDFRGARDTFYERDLTELNLARTYIEQGKGMIVGFCRGHQIIGVAQGLKLIQDIPSDLRFRNGASHTADATMSNDHGRESAYHDIQIAAESTLLRDIFGARIIQVNSRHHQAIEYDANHSTVIMSATEGENKLVEAMEFKNGRGYTFQFHPEDMQTDVSRAILKEITKRTNEIYEFNQHLNHRQAPRYLCRGWKLRL